MTEVLFVGESPGKSPGDPLAGRSGRFLADLMGLEGSIADHFPAVNLIERDLAGVSKSSPKIRGEARVRAEEIEAGLTRGAQVVLLGRMVATAFFFEHVPWFTWRQRYVGKPSRRMISVSLVAVPHPSGLNRVWNDPRVRGQARRFLRTSLL